MPERTRALLLTLTAFALIGACAPATTVDTRGEGVSIVKFSAQERATIVQNPTRLADGSTTIAFVCSEPPPDAIVTSSMEALARLDLAEAGVDAEARLEVIQAALELGDRTQAIQAQRDMLFHICALHANGALTGEEVRQLVDEVLYTLRVLAFVQLLENLRADTVIDAPTLGVMLRVALQRGEAAALDSPAALGAPRASSCEELLRITDDSGFRNALASLIPRDTALADLETPDRGSRTVRERLESRCAAGDRAGPSGRAAGAARGGRVTGDPKGLRHGRVRGGDRGRRHRG
jgi:hypothetical protein